MSESLSDYHFLHIKPLGVVAFKNKSDFFDFLDHCRQEMTKFATEEYNLPQAALEEHRYQTYLNWKEDKGPFYALGEEG